MPSAKKSTASTTKKSAKKPSAKRPAPARTATKTSVKRVSPARSAHRSFRVSRESEPFFTFRITHQTLYWLILCGLVLALGAWVLSINNKVQHIYDQIDQATESEMVMPVVKKK